MTALTFVSFIFMVGRFYIFQKSNWPVSQVISSIIAAWSDVSSAFSASLPATSPGVSTLALKSAADALKGLNAGYFWMFMNCLTSAAYVSVHTSHVACAHRKGMIGTFDAKENQTDRVFRLGFNVLQQLAQHSPPYHLLLSFWRLGHWKLDSQFVRLDPFTIFVVVLSIPVLPNHVTSCWRQSRSQVALQLVFLIQRHGVCELQVARLTGWQ